MATKNPAAVALGKLGGLAKVTKGFGSRTPEERKANAKRAAEARWGKKKPAKRKTAKRKTAKRKAAKK